MGEEDAGKLPPGFRFEPTDEELILHFLYPKAAHLPCFHDIIPELHLHPSCDLWDLHGKALWSSESECYYLSQKMENRATRNGYWKEVEEKPIFTSTSGKKVGVKKYLELYIGGAPEAGGLKTDWKMHEYHLCTTSTSSAHLLAMPRKMKANRRVDIDKWVLCHVQETIEGWRDHYRHGSNDEGYELSYLDEVFVSIEDEDDDDAEISSSNF
ncbi:hypothetical protein NMG60_11007037 [Bertholletia excelsa]